MSLMDAWEITSRTNARIACASKVAKETQYRQNTVTSVHPETAKITAWIKEQ